MCQLVQFSAAVLAFVLFCIQFNTFRKNFYPEFSLRKCYSEQAYLGKTQTGCEHRLFYCGDTAINLTYPFRFKGDRDFCGETEFELSCDHNRTVIFLSTWQHSIGRHVPREYYVDSIDFKNQTFIVIDPLLERNNCSTLPLLSFNYYDVYSLLSIYPVIYPDDAYGLIFVSCKNPVKSESHLFVDTASCNITARQLSKNNNISLETSFNYSYAVVADNLSPSDIEESCTIYSNQIPVLFHSLPNVTGRNISYQDIHKLLANGIRLGWSFYSTPRKFFCILIYMLDALGLVLFNPITLLVIGPRNGIGIILLLAFFIYKWRRRHLSMNDKVEEFLQTNKSLMPIRYSYREIKTMTKNFKEKLGEGGYGSVYKGKLRSGQLAAIKMLKKSKANGQDFMNEVATIGRIHHVNVVRLVRFCATATKHALVYDYMANGSLDKFIFSEYRNDDPLSWKKVYEIAIGVARGIEYLHQGCNMQILHFDIKPHNILLDENFVPKVSDFGLAKLYPIQDAYIATLTAVRGTIGYIAPELFYPWIGRVSYKADVYSFGMLLMELAGRRRNVNAHAEQSSQIYYPSWIYDQFYKGEDIEFGDVIEEEKGIARKLILIALWCIQMTPTDRPSMREILRMLEGYLEGMQLPSKPLYYPLDSPILSQRISHSYSGESMESQCNTTTLEIEQIVE